MKQEASTTQTTLIKPHLEYAVQFWSPYYGMDIGLSVQRRMTKKIQGIRKFSYARRLKLLKLLKLERRRIRG